MKKRWPPLLLSVGLVALLTPAVAAANFVWPPALYYASFTGWWIVAAGLAAEMVVYVFGLKLSARKAVGVSSVTNAASAAIGFLVTWPLLFYEPGIDLALRTLGVQLSIVAIAASIIALNVVVEYWVAVRWCSLLRSRAVIGSVVVANLLSFVLVVVSIPTWFKM